jgi:hypothetical protein
MLCVTHALTIPLDSILYRIAELRQKVRAGLTDGHDVGVAAGCGALKQDVPQVVARTVVTIIAQVTRLATQPDGTGLERAALGRRAA